MFDEFWSQYPNKSAKAHARIMWGRLTAGEVLLALEALPNHLKAWSANGTERMYIPHAASWLNPKLGRRWEDEIEISAPKEAKALAWWTTDSTIMAKGAEVGLTPRGGEGWPQFKSRIAEKLRIAA